MKDVKNPSKAGGDAGKKAKKPKTMDELRRPASILPPTDEEYHIVTPGGHVVEGQDTHE